MVETITLESLLNDTTIDNDYSEYSEDNLIDIDIFDIAEMENDLSVIDQNCTAMDIVYESMNITTEEWNRNVSQGRFTFNMIMRKIADFIVNILHIIIKIVMMPFILIGKLIQYIRKKTSTPADITREYYMVNNIKEIQFPNSPLEDFANSFASNAKIYAETIAKTDRQVLDSVKARLTEVGGSIKKAISTLDSVKNGDMARYVQAADYKLGISEQSLLGDKIDNIWDLKSIKDVKFANGTCNLADSLTKLISGVDKFRGAENDCRALQKEADVLLKTLEEFDKNIKNTDLDKLKDNEKELIKSVMNTLRQDINMVAAHGVNISKWFSKASTVISSIYNVAGLNKDIYFMGKNRSPDDTFNGFPVYITEYAYLSGGAYSIRLATDNYVSRCQAAINQAIFVKNAVDNRGDTQDDVDFISIQGAARNVIDNGGGELENVIVISPLVASWKTDKPKWYNFIMGHESGHLTSKTEHLGLGVVDDETNQDTIGVNVSGITDEEFELMWKTLLPKLKKAHQEASYSLKVLMLGGYNKGAELPANMYINDVKKVLRVRWGVRKVRQAAVDEYRNNNGWDTNGIE